MFTRKKKGTYIVRIEDTDQERSTKEFAENILNGLRWLKLNWDKGPFYQMQRLDIYKKASEKLLEEGKAYYCFCTKEELDEERKKQIESKRPQVYSGKCRNLTKEEVLEKLNSNTHYAIRYKLPDDRGVVEFEDMIHGKVSIDSSLLGDMVIMRQNGIPLYNFAVVLDDWDMRITHVLRGDDHISNTPKQILFFEALEVNPPHYGHYPVILNQDRVGKLSKRTGSTSLEDYKKEGYLPEALINYLVLLGWTPPEDKEILSLDEMIEIFDIKDMNKSPGAWDEQKLEWINGEYIRAMLDEDLTKKLEEYLVDHPDKEKIAQIVPLIKERIKKLSDFIPLTDFLFEKAEYEKEIFTKVIGDGTKLIDILLEILKALEDLPKVWKAKEFEDIFRQLANKLGLSATQIFQLIRVAVSGQLVTPPLFESIKILGEEEAIKRVKEAISFLKAS